MRWLALCSITELSGRRTDRIYGRSHPWHARPIGLNCASCAACKQVYAWSNRDAHVEDAGGNETLGFN
jgi:hypothetical protein